MAEKGKEEKTTRKPDSEKNKDFKDPNLPEEGAKASGEGKSKSNSPEESTKSAPETSSNPPGESANKSPAKEPEKTEPEPDRQVVRGEDVLDILRKKGVKI